MISRRQFTKLGLVGLATATYGSTRMAVAQDAPPASAVAANPLYATDGEKLVAVVNGERVVVRLICCDAPEPQTEENKTECGFRESRQALHDAIAGRTLLLESDEEDQDSKGRLWRHVWLVNADGTNGGLLNQQLLAQGWVTPQEEKTNVKHANEYAAAAKEASENNLVVNGLCQSFHEEINRRGGHDDPGGVGETIDVDGVWVTLNSYYYSYVDTLGSAAKGGYKYLIANVTITNLRESGKYNYNRLDFAGKDMNTAADYDDTFAFLNSELGSGELSPTEYVSGDVALEVQESATLVRIKYTVSRGKALYWLAPA